MGNRGQSEGRAIAESRDPTSRRHYLPHDNDPRPILQEVEAIDVRWYFTSAESAMGIHASNPASGGGGSFVEGAERKHVSLRNHRHRDAVTRERRIRKRLAQINPVSHRVLQIAYEPKNFGPQVESRVGKYANLALHLPRARTAYEAYLVGFKTTVKRRQVKSPAEWLVDICKDEQSQRAKLFRDEAELALAAALEDYRATTGSTPADERRAARAAAETATVQAYERETGLR